MAISPAIPDKIGTEVDQMSTISNFLAFNYQNSLKGLFFMPFLHPMAVLYKVEKNHEPSKNHRLAFGR